MVTAILITIAAIIGIAFFVKHMAAEESEEIYENAQANYIKSEPSQQAATESADNPAEPETDTTAPLAEAPEQDAPREEIPKDESTAEQNADETMAQRILIDVFRKLGCEPIVESDSGITVKYQGAFFSIFTSGPNAMILYPNWAKIKYEPNKIAYIHECINEVNYGTATVFITNPDENGEIYFISRADVMAHNAYPIDLLADYVHFTINNLFNSRRQVEERLNDIIMEQSFTKQTGRTIGFETPAATTDQTE